MGQASSVMGWLLVKLKLQITVYLLTIQALGTINLLHRAGDSGYPLTPLPKP